MARPRALSNLSNFHHLSSQMPSRALMCLSALPSRVAWALHRCLTRHTQSHRPTDHRHWHAIPSCWQMQPTAQSPSQAVIVPTLLGGLTTLTGGRLRDLRRTPSNLVPTTTLRCRRRKPNLRYRSCRWPRGEAKRLAML